MISIGLVGVVLFWRPADIQDRGATFAMVETVQRRILPGPFISKCEAGQVVGSCIETAHCASPFVSTAGRSPPAPAPAPGQAPLAAWGTPPWQGSLRAELGEPPDLALYTSVWACGGHLRGPVAVGHEASGVGWGGLLGLRVLQQLVIYVDLDRPPLRSADPNPTPLSDSSSLQLYGGGLRGYLNPYGWVQPYVSVGAATFKMDSTYSIEQSSSFGSVSAAIASMTLKGTAWRLGTGVDLRLYRVAVGRRVLSVLATASVEYLLATWDEMYCFDERTEVATEGALGGCLYEGSQGAFQDSDLVLMRLGLGVQY